MPNNQHLINQLADIKANLNQNNTNQAINNLNALINESNSDALNQALSLSLSQLDILTFHAVNQYLKSLPFRLQTGIQNHAADPDSYYYLSRTPEQVSIVRINAQQLKALINELMLATITN